MYKCTLADSYIFYHHQFIYDHFVCARRQSKRKYRTDYGKAENICNDGTSQAVGKLKTYKATNRSVTAL